MSERTGRSKERTNNLRRRNRGRTVERSRSPLSDAGLGSDTMSKEQLLLGLKSLGVELPSTLGVRYIRQVYDRLTGTTGTQNQTQNVAPNENSSAGRQTEVNNAAGNGSPGNSANESSAEVCRQLIELQSAVASINHRLNSTGTTATGENQTGSGSQWTQGIPIDSLPQINVISSQLKKSIQERKHVNLALLLIPGMSNDTETRIIDSGGNQIVVKSTDSRLTRSLQIEEFRQAFSLYRNVICEKEPLRRAELDTYYDFIESLHSQFGGSNFYDYHNAFSKKAAMYYSQSQIAISWAHKDTDLYLRIFAGEKSRACDSCKSMLHSTRFCPEALSNSSASRFNSGGVPTTDRRGRQRLYHEGKEICNNYNTSRGCNMDHNNSNFVHLCRLCKATSHSAVQCPSKQLKNGNISQENGAARKK